MAESAITELTRTVRDKDPNRTDINELYSLFRLHFIPERNKFHSRAVFFSEFQERKVKQPKTSGHEFYNCKFENVIPAELIASKFSSLIGRSTGDYELKKKIRKNDMTIETIADLIHKCVYDRINETNKSNDGKEIQHIQERQFKQKMSHKSSYERPRKKPDNQKPKYKDNRCGQCAQTGQDCTTAQQNPLSVVIAKEVDITRRCADH